ncbi:MAG: hypothetical protein LBT14_06665 [Treponema sp.]|jgi:hypothetical protein|nr:hypothetical protein [Treponema sp.]
MSYFFYKKHLKLFDFHKVFTPVTEEIKANAERIAKENGVAIEYIRNTKAFRKEDRIAEIIKERGTEEGLVHFGAGNKRYL